MSFLALIIGYLGIVTNLTLSITERVRELGLLRALGMSSRQVGAAVRFESAIIAALGALVGTALGLFVGWALQRALTSDGITVLAIPWGTLAAYVVLAVVVGPQRPGSYPPAGPVESPYSRRSRRSDKSQHRHLCTWFPAADEREL